LSKYKFTEIDALDVLPVDCNEGAEKIALEYNDAGLMAMLRLYREKKITSGYGEATHLNKNGQPEIIFSFQNGICKHASPIVWVDGKNVAKGSIKFY
jgi:hypothetical protein